MQTMPFFEFQLLVEAWIEKEKKDQEERERQDQREKAEYESQQNSFKATLPSGGNYNYDD